MDIITATPAHFEGICGITNLLYPENSSSAQEMEEADKRRDPRFKFHRWVGIDQDQVIGAGSFSQSIWFDHPQNFMFWVGVHPARQCQGVGSALYETILEGLHPFHPLALRSTATEDQPESIRFLTKRGFLEVIRDVRSELDVQASDLARFSDLDKRFQGSGIEIKTLPELENDPDRNRKLYDLDWELSLLVPGDLAAGMGRRGLDRYVEYAISGPHAIPEAFFVAVKGQEYIGLSHAILIEKGVSLYQGLTGVKPPFQRLGLGLSMKLRVIAYARKNGYVLIRAENDSKNLPMLAMNKQLGYVRKHDLITFQKQYQTEEN